MNLCALVYYFEQNINQTTSIELIFEESKL
jgi:hypothetical protein